MKTRRLICSIKPAQVLAAYVLFALSGCSLLAQTYTWTGVLTGGTTNWNVDANWGGTPNPFPNAIGDIANLTGDFTAAPTINLNAATTVGSLTLQDTASTFFGFTIAPNGGSLIFDVASGSAALNSTTASSSVVNIISSGIQINDPLNITVTTSSLTLSGVISEGLAGMSITKLASGSSTGTLTLNNAANSYTGATLIQEGILNLIMNGNIGVSANSVIGNAASAVQVGTSSTGTNIATTLNFTAGSDAGNYTMSRGIDFSQAPTTDTGAAQINFNGDGVGGLNLNTLTLAGDMVFCPRSERITAARSGMTINITGNITQGAGTATGIVINGGPPDPNVDGHGPGIVRFSNVTRSFTAPITLGMGTVVIDGTVGALTANSPIGTTAIQLNAGNSGNAFAGANFSTGAAASRDTSVDTIRAIFLDSAGSSFARTLTVGGATLSNPTGYGAVVNVLNGYEFGGNNTSGTTTFSGAITPGDVSTGNSSLNVITTGINTALIAQNGGTVVFNGAISDTPDAATSMRLTINQFRNHPNLDGVNNSTLIVAANGSGNDQIPDATANQLVGTTTTGTVVLNGANSYVGTTEVLGGTLQLGNSTALGFGGRQNTTTGTATVTSGAVLDLNGTTSINKPIILNGTGISSGGALINSSSTAASISNGIAGIQLGSVSTGSGYSTAPTVTISGTGSGATATATLGLTTASITSITSGGTGWVVGDYVNFTAAGGSGALGQVTAVSSGVVTAISVVKPGSGYTAGPTAFAKNTSTAGAGTTTLTGNAANFTISGLTMTAAGTGYTGTPTYTFGSGNATPGTVTLSSVTLGSDSSIGGTGDIAINSVISDGGGAKALTKVGTGKLTFNGANTYTGTTTVNAGTLGGSGTISGTVTVNAGGSIAPGASSTNIGTLTLSAASGSALTLQGNNNLTFKVSAASQDKIALTGTGGGVMVNGNVYVALSFPQGVLPAGSYNLITASAKSGSGTVSLAGSYPNCSLAWSGGNLVLTVTGSGVGPGPAYDNFDSYSGALTGGTGGGGWSGNWALGTGTSPSADATSLGTVSTVVSTSPNEKASAIATEFRSTRTIAAVTSGNLYVSALVKLTGTISGSDSSFGGIQLYNGANELFLFGKQFQHTVWGCTDTSNAGGGGTAVNGDSAKSIASGTTVLLVGKVDIANKKLSMWVNPDLTKAESDQTADVANLSLGSGSYNIDTVVLRAGNNSGHTWQYDNVAAGANSPFSAVPPLPPSTPTVTIGCASLTVNWTTQTGATSYNVYRKLSGGSYGAALQTGVTSTSFSDGTAAAGSTYVYAVTAVNGNGESAKSADSASASPNAVPAQTITAPSSVCANTAGNTASVTTTASATYGWSISGGTITAGQTGSTVTFTAGASGSVVLNCMVTSSAGCASAGGQNISVTINPTSVGGTAAALNPTLISGNTTTVTVSGSTGSIQWQQSADGSTGWANVTGGSGPTSATYTTPALTQTTYYRALLTSGVCSSANSTTASVTVVTKSSISSVTGASVCSGSSANLTVSASGSATLNYAWHKTSQIGWGTGNAWSFTYNSGNCDSFNGTYIGDSTAGGGSPGINSSGKAFGLYANTFNNVEALRSFGSLTVGQSAVFDYQNPVTMTGSSGSLKTIALFALRDSSGVARFELFVQSGDTQYTVNDNAPLNNSSGIAYTSGGLHCVFTLTGANTYNLTITKLVDGTVTTFTGRTLMGTSGNAISQLRAYFRNFDGGGTARDFFLNNIFIGNGYYEDASGYTAGGCGSWANGSNNGEQPLAGANLTGTNSATLTINPATAGDAGTYDLVAYNNYGLARSSAAALTVNALPTAFSVTGGGAYCAGGSGVAIGLANSQSGVNYQLYRNGGATAVGSPVAGTGSAISFGNQTTADAYTVVAVNATTSCTSGMTGTATVTMNALPTIALGTSPSLTYGTTSANLPYSATGNGADQYIITYDSTAHAAGFTDDGAFASLPSSPITFAVPATAPIATYNGNITVRNSTTGCIGSSAPFTVTVTKATPTISGVTASQSISYGAANVSLSGNVSAGAGYPTDGETVSVTINGNTQNASITGGAGSFSVSFLTVGIPPSTNTYTITYAYAGDANLNAAANNTTTALTVTGIKVPNLTYTNAPGSIRIITLAEIQAAGLVSSQSSPAYVITNLSATSAGGFVITNSSGTLIKYTNAPSFASASDSFTYTLTDGAASGTGTVTLTFTNLAGPQISSGTTDGLGHPVLTFQGLPGYSYHLQRASTLTPPNWANQDPAISVPLDGNGSVTWTNNQNDPVPSPAFFRLSYP